MHSDSRSFRSLRGAVAAGALVALAGCASGAWRQTDDVAYFGVFDLPPDLPPHRAVELVTLRVRGHEFEFVGYRTCDPAQRDVRSQLLLESGISVLDVAVRGAQDRRISGSAFEAIPRLAEIAMADLRRTWGARSVFCRTRAGGQMSAGGTTMRSATNVTDGRDTFPADRVADGSWVAIAPRGADRAGPIRVTLFTPDLVPEATITYADFDGDGVPREIRLVDLRDEHTLDVEIEEVRVAPQTSGP